MKINLCTVLGANFVYGDLKVPHYIVATKGKEIRLFKAASVLSFWMTRRIVKGLLTEEPKPIPTERKRRFHDLQKKDVIEMQAIYSAAAQGMSAANACEVVIGGSFNLSATTAEGVLKHVNACE